MPFVQGLGLVQDEAASRFPAVQDGAAAAGSPPTVQGRSKVFSQWPWSSLGARAQCGVSGLGCCPGTEMPKAAQSSATSRWRAQRSASIAPASSCLRSAISLSSFRSSSAKGGLDASMAKALNSASSRAVSARNASTENRSSSRAVVRSAKEPGALASAKGAAPGAHTMSSTVHCCCGTATSDGALNGSIHRRIQSNRKAGW
mmetsp:Transcript_5845/g.12458  ORF Transcript_5845/g.12458 Transcript_5845/m.12458 type:complete len:202 (+) Transcript_5845:333-938(+)